MGIIGQSVTRVDAPDKVTGRAKYTDDLADKSALIAKVLHSTIAHGYVKSIDTSEAERIKGVVKIVTCFDVPDIPFPTAGHPWSTDVHHQDIADRLLLNRHVRYYGDDVAAVVARDEVSAAQAIRAIKVEYEELPFVLDPIEAMRDGAPQIHEGFDHNILAHTSYEDGNYEETIKEPGLIVIDKWYDTPTVQHCHIENHICYAYEEAGKINVVSSTQIPHIVRRIVGQALGREWGSVRIVKPYIGGGFGNKQDALYEPLCAWCCTQVGGRLRKRSQATACAMLSATISCPMSARTEHSLRAGLRRIPTRARMQATATAFAPRARARSGSFTATAAPARGTPIPSTQT